MLAIKKLQTNLSSIGQREIDETSFRKLIINDDGRFKIAWF